MNRHTGSTTRVLTTALVGAVLAALALSYAEADNGGYAKDGCHVHNRGTPEEVIHDRDGHRCERLANGATRIYVEVPGKTPPSIRHVRVQKFEEAMDRALTRLEAVIKAEAERPAKVVTVEKKVLVRDNSQASAECVELRNTFLKNLNAWNNRSEDAGQQAIHLGCW